MHLTGSAPFLAALMVGFSLSCGGAAKMETMRMEKVSEEEVSRGLGALSSGKTFFGHQSVGWNIIEGLEDLSSLKGESSLHIVETRSASGISGPGFYHASVGKNADPVSKLRDFEAILRGGVGRSVDVAFIKLCYVDIDERTDIAALFAAYHDTMSRLQAGFPDLTLVHFTVPLTVDESGIKVLIKRLIGRKVAGHADNEKKEAFNRRIRAEYTGKASVFDLALVEASGEDGLATGYSVDGIEHYALRREYSSDGGHLNSRGRRRAAAYLLAELGRVLARGSDSRAQSRWRR
jgi:hypothetical protein